MLLSNFGNINFETKVFDDQLVSFSALTLGLVIWPVKIVPEMTIMCRLGR